MAEVFTSACTNSAAAIIADLSIPALDFSSALGNDDEKHCAFSKRIKHDCASKLYEEMMRHAVNLLLKSLPQESIKKPLSRYSQSIKTLTVCSLYLVAVENCQVRKAPPSLVALLMETMLIGNKIEPTPSAEDIIAEFGWQPKSALIANIATLSLGYMGCSSNEVNQRLIDNLSLGATERMELLQKVIGNFAKNQARG